MIVLQKYHGLGNDYLIYDPNKNETILTERQVELLCRRHFGVGADGVLYGPLICQGEIHVKIYNPDGSEAERSGNGIRIFSRYLKDNGYVMEKRYTLVTKAGAVEVDFLDDAGEKMRVDMGYANFNAPVIPVVGLSEEVINEPVFFYDNFYNVTCVSMGNPNCVILLEEVSVKKVLRLGPYVENSKFFPNRINLQLCKILDRKNIQIEIYERGVGYTNASGTGACAAAAASHRLNLVEDEVTVHMQGGTLLIEFDKDQRIHMTGPAVYIGSITLAENFFA